VDGGAVAVVVVDGGVVAVVVVDGGAVAVVVVDGGVVAVVVVDGGAVAVVLVVPMTVVVVAPAQVIWPARHAASAVDRHCPRTGVPGGRQVARTCDWHVSAPHSTSLSPSKRWIAPALEHVPDEQASQQLAWSLAHAVPPRVALQAAALRLTLQCDLPPVVRQHATKPGRPHVERAAQRTIPPLQAGRSCPCLTELFTDAVTQPTNAPWF